MPDIKLECKTLKPLTSSVSNRTRSVISPISATFLQKENIHPNFVEELRSRKVLRMIPSIYKKKKNNPCKVSTQPEKKMLEHHSMLKGDIIASNSCQTSLVSSNSIHLNNHRSEWMLTVLQLLIVSGIFMYVMFYIKSSSMS